MLLALSSRPAAALLAFAPLAFSSLTPHGESVVVADRGSGTLSVIDVGTDRVRETIRLPGPGAAEPMYVVQDGLGRTWVGDRANRRVVWLDRELHVGGSVPAGEGVFHMWADPSGRELWVVNDLDEDLSVIDTHARRPLARVPLPADLLAGSAFPHDVTVGPRFVYVSIIAPDHDGDWVVQLERGRGGAWVERGRLVVGDDPHFGLAGRKLYVPCQGSDAVYVLGARDLELLGVRTIPGAHGAAVDRRRQRFYTTNLSGGGSAALWSLDTRTDRIVTPGVDAGVAVPHNVAVSSDGRKLYVTHSGADNDRVTVYRVDAETGMPSKAAELVVGRNPFGLARVD